MKRQGSAIICFCVILLVKVAMGAAFSAPSSGTARPISRTTKETEAAESDIPNNQATFDQSSAMKSSTGSTEIQKRNLPFSSWWGWDRNQRQRPKGQPTFFQKQRRRLTVFRIALGVFIDYKLAGRKANKLKHELGLNAKDSDSDDHPDVLVFWSQVHTRNAQFLLQKIKSLEGFWVKVGQYLSSRGDIMPPEYLTTLSELQDSMPPRSWEDTWQTIQDELSEEDRKRLIEIDEKPLSTASLAQVHRAILTDKDDDTKRHNVVLKVQHRGVASLMLQDMDNLRAILKLLAMTDPNLDFGPVIREYNQEVRKELDFRIEAQNMKDVSQLIEDADVKIIIPKTISGLVTERVLVMDFCEGFAVRDTEKLQEYHVNRELLLERICFAWAVQMHVGGVFNCDPHSGNVLVSTAVPGDSSVPVLLDFGLTKRLEPDIKLAFARLMHASYESDIDALLQSFDEMGLKMNRHDPFQDMANMQRGFGDTIPQSQAREYSKQRSQEYERRREAEQVEANLKKGQKLRNPVEAWPSELVFFGRVTAMLRGMCSRLDVNYPYLQTMAMAARETLRASVPLEEHALDLIHPSAETVSTKLQHRLIDALHDLDKKGQLVGLQVCVLKQGEEIANIAAGTLGSANPRPVTPTSLFNVFSVSKGVLSIALLRLVQDGRIEDLDDPVAKYWEAFQSKPSVTVRHLLTHQSGLANAYPEDATLDTLLDWSTMTNFVAEHALPSHEPGTETEYHALSFAWLVGGLIEAVTGQPYEEWLDEILLPHRNRALYLAGISEDVCNQRDLTVLSVDRTKPAKTQAKEISQHTIENKKKGTEESNSSPAKQEIDEHKSEEEKKKEAKKVLAKYRGLQQLMNPSIFNMRKVREAKLPSANGHASAVSLAEVFDALIRSNNKYGNDPLLSREMLERARTPATIESQSPSTKKASLLNDAQAKFGLGFQLHNFILSSSEGQSQKGVSLGHSGVGGSLVLAMPEDEVVISLTLNHLGMSSQAARDSILKIIFEELGWQAPASILS